MKSLALVYVALVLIVTEFVFASSLITRPGKVSAEDAIAYSVENPSQQVGILKAATPLDVYPQSSQTGMSKVKVRDTQGRSQIVLVPSHMIVLQTASPVVSKDALKELKSEEGENEEEILQPLSLGAGMSGYSSKSESHIQVSGELRYLWNRRNETLFGVDLNFGSNPGVGAKVGERYYFKLSKSWQPYLHFGIRAADVRDADSLAWDPGLGIQFVHSKGAYVDLGVNFLWATPFNSSSENIWIFGGSSGLRF